MSNFGALTDHFGVLDLSANLTLVASSETKIEQSRADAQDDNGDIAASAYFGNSTQDMREVSCTYALKAGSINLNVIKLGALAASPTIARDSLSASTSNSEFPQITVTGRKNIIAITAPAGKLNTFTLPSITILGIKKAQILCFTTGSGCRLTGSSIEATVELAQQDDGLGEPVAHGISGGTGTIGADFVRITTAPSWTIVTTDNTAFGITETQAPGLEQGQAAWHTSAAAAAFTIIRDDAP